MSSDISDLTRFAADLRAGAHEVRGGVHGVVSKAGLNVKNDARKNLKSSHHRPTSVPWLVNRGAITYDLERIETQGWETEVGPDQAISGLGRGVEYGSQHHAPMPFLIPAFNDEAPKFEEASGNLLDKIK